MSFPKGNCKGTNEVKNIDPLLLICIVTVDKNLAQQMPICPPIQTCHDVAKLYQTIETDIMAKRIPKDPEAKGEFSRSEVEKVRSKFFSLYNSLDHSSSAWKKLDRVVANQGLLNFYVSMEYPSDAFDTALYNTYGQTFDQNITMLDEIRAVLELWNSADSIEEILRQYNNTKSSLKKSQINSISQILVDGLKTAYNNENLDQIYRLSEDLFNLETTKFINDYRYGK
jgi:hypothetical protein